MCSNPPVSTNIFPCSFPAALVYGFIVIPDGNPDRLEYTLGYYYKSDLQNDQLKTAVSRKCVYGFHEVDNVPNTQGYYQLLTNDSDSDEAWSIMEFVVISDS